MKKLFAFIPLVGGVALVIGFAVGYRVGAADDLVFKDGAIYTERGVSIAASEKDFDVIDQIFHHTEVEGVSISGSIVSISTQDVSEIKNEMNKIEGIEPILSFRVISESQVEVQTGEIRGPLDGGGRVYDVRKKNKKWEVDLTNIGFWMSESKMRTTRRYQGLRSFVATA